MHAQRWCVCDTRNRIPYQSHNNGIDFKWIAERDQTIHPCTIVDSRRQFLLFKRQSHVTSYNVNSAAKEIQSLMFPQQCWNSHCSKINFAGFASKLGRYLLLSLLAFIWKLADYWWTGAKDTQVLGMYLCNRYYLRISRYLKFGYDHVF